MIESKDKSDIWSRWLLQRWHGGNTDYKNFLHARAVRLRDRVLDTAKLSAGMTLMDVGTGDGLVGFGAIDRIGSSLHVIFTDLSAPLLAYTEQLAKERGVRSQCAFLLGSAERLASVENASVDVVATRASLAYMSDKPSAIREFFRVLKPQGRISIAEPILQDDAFSVRALAKMIEAHPNHPQAEFLRLLHRYRSTQYPSDEQQIYSNPLTNFTERDLLHMACEAGFQNVHLELHVDYKRPAALGWETQLDIAPHPWAPTLRETLAGFSAEESMLFERGFRPMIESGQPVVHHPVAYLTAEKPGN